MITVTGIDHLVLRTPDPLRLVNFYRDVLGCALERSLPPDAGLYQLRAGSGLIDIVDTNSELGRQGGKPPRRLGNNLDHFCLQVEGTPEKLLAHLREQGLSPGDFEERYGANGYGPSLYITDPDGNTLELRPTGA